MRSQDSTIHYSKMVLSFQHTLISSESHEINSGLELVGSMHILMWANCRTKTRNNSSDLIVKRTRSSSISMSGKQRRPLIKWVVVSMPISCVSASKSSNSSWMTPNVNSWRWTNSASRQIFLASHWLIRWLRSKTTPLHVRPKRPGLTDPILQRTSTSDPVLLGPQI